jgi:formamidopyrimidine-DNA glycosylase
MPELPEVETSVRALRPLLLGRTITSVRNSWPRHVITPSLAELEERISGRHIEAAGRRGKFLVFSLSDDENLIIHLRMSGHLSVVDAGEPADAHTHTIFTLDNGRELRFRDPRKFGCVYLVHDPEEVLGKLGPEPLEPGFTVEALQERLRGRRRVLKPLLLDQSFLAGVGNIYADEALFYARLHPRRTTDTLTAEEIFALHSGLQKVLQAGIANEGASITTYVKPDGEKGNMQNVTAVYDRKGQPCPRCGTPIERIVLGGRSTYFCPSCQLL